LKRGILIGRRHPRVAQEVTHALSVSKRVL
jgi:hypothetical protein